MQRGAKRICDVLSAMVLPSDQGTLRLKELFIDKVIINIKTYDDSVGSSFSRLILLLRQATVASAVAFLQLYKILLQEGFLFLMFHFVPSEVKPSISFPRVGARA